MEDFREHLYQEKIEELKEIIKNKDMLIEKLKNEGNLLYIKNAGLEFKLKQEKEKNEKINKDILKITIDRI